MKALCFAVAIAASVVPASAGELSLAPRSVQVNEADASRLYRAEWLAAYTRPGRLQAAFATGGAESKDAAANSLSALDAAPAAFDDRFRALVGRVKDELRRAGVDPRKVRSRLRVRCTMKYVSVKRALPAGPMPVSAWSGQAAGARNVVRTAVKEVCHIRLTLSPRAPSLVPQFVEQKRSFSITLPSLDEISQ